MPKFECPVCGSQVDKPVECGRCFLDSMITCYRSRQGVKVDFARMQRYLKEMELKESRMVFERDHPALFCTRAGQ